jgi:hypothetical protein
LGRGTGKCGGNWIQVKGGNAVPLGSDTPTHIRTLAPISVTAYRKVVKQANSQVRSKIDPMLTAGLVPDSHPFFDA